MKKSAWILPIVFLSFAFNTSCQKKDNIDRNPGYLTTDKKAAELIAADNAFAYDLLSETDKINEEDNFMLSPLSVAMALGMTYNGAENETKQAFEQTLRLNGLSRHDLNRIHGDLLTYLIKADPRVTLEIANSIWVHNLYTLMKAFADTNAYYYKAEVANIDFRSNDATETINNWVSDNTHGKIPAILDQIPPDAVMYLINAIYFNGTWTFAFDKNKTGDMPFHYRDGSVGQVSTMQMEGDIEYYRNDLFRAVELPYGSGKFVMDILLPGEAHTVSDLTAWLTANGEGSWLMNFSEAKDLLIKLPKFKFEYSTILNEALKNMGLGNAFSASADFSGMLEELKNLSISRVIHKTFIDVNEQGTEAAAVTAVEIEYTSVSEPSSFIVDRPFLFILREKKTGAVVFTGKVEKPVYEE